MEIFPFIFVLNPSYFWTNLKSISTYQNGLESKELCGKMLVPSTSETKFHLYLVSKTIKRKVKYLGLIQKIYQIRI